MMSKKNKKKRNNKNRAQLPNPAPDTNIIRIKKMFCFLFLVFVLITLMFLLLVKFTPKISLFVFILIQLISFPFAAAIIGCAVKLFVELFINNSTKKMKKYQKRIEMWIKTNVGLNVMVFILVLISSTTSGYGIHVANVEIEHQSTEEEQIVVYNFSTILDENEEFDIYFEEENDTKHFLSNLINSLTNIQQTEIPTEETLEGPNAYGNNAELAVADEKKLHLLSKTQIRSAEKLEDYCNSIIKYRKIMEKEYQTPENRRQLMDVYMRKGYIIDDVNISEKINCFEQAIKYSFACFYTEISWGNYSEYSLNKIIEMYEHLDKYNIEHDKNIAFIIDTLKELKLYFKMHPPVS